MDRNVPPLPALWAFEATVRCGSMTAAATELETTQPAVSQRIHQLEEHVGLMLMDRSKRGSAATAQGRLYYDSIVGALSELSEATARVRNRAERMSRRREITIAAHFGFAHHWLLPRLESLEAAFPDVDFHVRPVDNEHSHTADLMIRFAAFSEARPYEARLISEQVYPVCSPTLAERYALANTLSAAAINRLPLLHLDDRDPRWLDWSRWSRMANLSPPTRPIGFEYNNYPLLINAAIEGQGLALAWHGLVQHQLVNHRLVAFEPSVKRPEYGYLATVNNARSTGLQPVLDWLIAHT